MSLRHRRDTKKDGMNLLDQMTNKDIEIFNDWWPRLSNDPDWSELEKFNDFVKDYRKTLKCDFCLKKIANEPSVVHNDKYVHKGCFEHTRDLIKRNMTK